MNIQRIPEYLLRWGVTLGGVGLALFLAKSLGDGKSGMVAGVFFGIFCVILALVLREKIWILIPTFWPLIGKMEILPIAFTVRDIVTIYVFSAVFALIAFKVIRRASQFSFVDLLFLVNVLWLFTTLLRNSVGLEVTDSGRVGGRPYFEALIGFFALLVLGRMTASVRLIRLLPIFTLSAVGAIFLLNVLIHFVPELTPVITQFYGGMDVGSYAQLDNIASAENALTGRRYEMFRDIGRYTTIFLCSYTYPPHLLLPSRSKFYVAAATVLGLLLSGFRSFLVYAGGMFFIGTWFRSGLVKSFLYAGIALGVVLLTIIGHGSIYQLPFAAQRALGFLPEALIPGHLDPIAIQAGTSSTNWRTEMWIEALTTNRYIENHWVGDGFGFSKRQLDAITRMSARTNTYQETQETMAIVGDFHSGPVSTIRVTGYVGLVFAYLLFVALAKMAIRLIRQTSGTPFFAPTLFFCMPILFELFWYTFVFGGHSAVIPFAGFGLGMMKLIQGSFDQWKAEGENQASPKLADFTPSLQPATEQARL